MNESQPRVRLTGRVPARIWGLELEEWQRRAWAKAGARLVEEGEADILVGTDWILSPALHRGLMAKPGVALVVEEAGTGGSRIAAINLGDMQADHRAQAAALAGQPCDDTSALEQAGLRPVSMRDIASDYNAALRKSEAPYALSVLSEAPARIERRQFKGAYKGVTDLVTKYAWPEPALHVTRWAARAGISPNTITTLSLVLVVLAFWLFWQGAWLPGLLAGWGMTFLDTVDGKLARTTMSYSPWGNIYDHGIDLIHPPFWYWAIHTGLVSDGTTLDPGLLTGALIVILAGYVLNRLEEYAFMTRFGFHIHVWRPVDSFMRVITARRNPNLLIMTVALLVGLGEAGFVAVAAWTVLCLLFHGVRVVQAYMRGGTLTSWLEG